MTAILQGLPGGLHSGGSLGRREGSWNCAEPSLILAPPQVLPHSGEVFLDFHEALGYPKEASRQGQRSLDLHGKWHGAGKQ